MPWVSLASGLVTLDAEQIGNPVLCPVEVAFPEVRKHGLALLTIRSFRQLEEVSDLVERLLAIAQVAASSPVVSPIAQPITPAPRSRQARRGGEARRRRLESVAAERPSQTDYAPLRGCPEFCGPAEQAGG